jgi:hypothetical protein
MELLSSSQNWVLLREREREREREMAMGIDGAIVD